MHSHYMTMLWCVVILLYVLILVLMEDALAPYSTLITSLESVVLILVLMEDALALIMIKVLINLIAAVLILVLMEDALAHIKKILRIEHSD